MKRDLIRRIPYKTIIITMIVTVSLTIGGVFLFDDHEGEISRPKAEIPDLELEKHNHEELYTCGMHPWIIEKEPGDCPICGMKLTLKRDNIAEETTNAERKIIYWRAPMNASEIYDKPGKSAMGMDLVPVYEDEVIGGVQILIDPVTEQNMGLRTTEVKKGALNHTIRTYGHITYDESRTFQINPKYSGWIEKLYVDFQGQAVKKGEPIFDIYSPELITVQEEYLEAFRNRRQSGNGILASAHRKLKLFDIADSEIREIKSAGKVKNTLTIRSPFNGIVIHKNAVEGGFFKTGDNIFTISDLSKIWVEAHIHEYELSIIKAGLEAKMTLPFVPGKEYTGKVTFVYPYLQQKTRDVVIRLEFDNPGLELKPDMFADVYIKVTGEKDGLMIPSESVIRSGSRNIVFVKRDLGKFSPREVTLGISLDNGMTQILTGLAPGETIVTSGQFLLDSESKLKEAVKKMMDAKKSSKVKSEQSEAEPPPDDFFDDLEPATPPSDSHDHSQADDFFKDMK